MTIFTAICTTAMVFSGISAGKVPSAATDDGNRKEEKGKYDVFTGHLGFTDAQNALYRYLSQQAYELLAERDAEVSAISTKEGWEERRNFVRKTLEECIGGFPERTTEGGGKGSDQG